MSTDHLQTVNVGQNKTGVTNARLTHMDGHAVLIYIHVAQGSNASDRYSV
jgi:hypothetical protein